MWLHVNGQAMGWAGAPGPKGNFHVGQLCCWGQAGGDCDGGLPVAGGSSKGQTEWEGGLVELGEAGKAEWCL